MGELAIRRNRGLPPPRPAETGKAEKSTAAGPAQKAAGKTGLTVSETLQGLMDKIGQAEESARESHRTLQTGEVALAEVQDRLEHMAELAQKAAGGDAPDRAALQQELEQLRQEIDRMLGGASAGGARLFLDDDGQQTPESLAFLSGNSASGQSLPSWLANGIAQNTLTPERLLSALGLDESASGADILSALSGVSLENNSAAGRLAALYLGAVISAGGSLDALDAASSADGLRQLLETMSEGVSPDQAIALLTGGTFTSLSDFQAQFTGGTLPGLQDFLYNILLSGSGDTALAGDALLSLLPGGGGAGEMELDFLMDLFAAVHGSGTSPDAAAENADVMAGADAMAGAEAAAGADASGLAGEAGAASPALQAGQFGPFQAAGQDLSGVSYDEASGLLTIGGEANVTIQGSGQAAILLTGSGTVTLQNASAASLTAASPNAQVIFAGENVLNEVRLESGTVLTLGGGPARIGVLLGDSSNTLRLTAGASVAVESQTAGVLTVPVILDGPVSFAAQAASVSSSNGKPLDAFDNLWKALLPGWSAITELSVDGRQAKLALTLQHSARLWLDRGDPSQGSPVHTVVIRGRDASARPKVRYAYLRWTQAAGGFEEVSMYPNPFTVTGGEEGRDWIYEEETQTLRILTDQVTSISGGSGTDAQREPFSGRIALSDGAGTVTLSLGGVTCRVGRGGAFLLGQENDVTLILQNGTRNLFESGPGRAGISLGDGSSLTIQRAKSLDGDRTPPGELTASGNGGGAGIGRDRGAGRDQTGQIFIRGGVITVSGNGGGAGVGSGNFGAIGDITITGGTLRTSGKGGGAGIGGALNAPAGNITIRGGDVTAAANCHAAAIGAGVQGSCGDILISGTARIRKALGGDPGADIGGCLFGGCGQVLISGAADVGRARLWTQPGVSLQMGEDAVTLPQFRLSSKAMGLDRLSLETQEDAKAAGPVLEADLQWVSRIQEAYSALYKRLEQNGLSRAERYYLVRDRIRAGELVEAAARAISLPSTQADRAHGKRGADWLMKLIREPPKR